MMRMMGWLKMPIARSNVAVTRSGISMEGVASDLLGSSV
jgi:hypothetical protein